MKIILIDIIYCYHFLKRKISPWLLKIGVLLPTVSRRKNPINRAGLGKYWVSVNQTVHGLATASNCIRTGRLTVSKPDA
jgi:hypothetical protein